MIARALVIAFLATSCVSSQTLQCGDRVCPSGDVCVASGCAKPGDVAACMGLADATQCTTTTGAVGTCQDGACRTGLCGNGALDKGEACDDGNQASGDGCRSDCAKAEMCGDAVLDDNESCDDGNTNAADGCDACAATSWTATAIVGSPLDKGAIELDAPWSVTFDAAGRLYYYDASRIWRVDLDGTVTPIAGNGTPGYSGDGGPALEAQISLATGLLVDGLGRVVFTDGNRIRRVDERGMITTIAGTGNSGFVATVDSGIATNIELVPIDVTIDESGLIYISDINSCVVWKLDDMGILTRFAGTLGGCTYGGENVDQTMASMYAGSLAYDRSTGALYVGEPNRVRKIFGGKITTIAGNGTAGYSGNGVATSVPILMTDLAVAPDGSVLITEYNIPVDTAANNRVRRIAGGMITTLVGTGADGTTGDGGPALAATISRPIALAVDPSGRIVITEEFVPRLRGIDVDASRTITTLVGSGAHGNGSPVGGATSTPIYPFGTPAVDAQGRLYIADGSHETIWRAELDGSLTRVAGAGIVGFSGDGGAATRANLFSPQGVAVDSQGRVIVVDSGNNAVRRVDATGTITTIAGTPPTQGYTSDGVATSVPIRGPYAVAVDAQDRVYIYEPGTCIVRRIDGNGTITRVAGVPNTCADSADGGQATSSSLKYVVALAVDSSGRVLMADRGAAKIRRIELDGTISTIAGNGTSGYTSDGISATTAEINPNGVGVDSTGQIYIADGSNFRIRQFTVGGTISTIVGDGTSYEIDGDGGPPANAHVKYTTGIAAVGGDLYITEQDRVRRIHGGIITTVMGSIDPPTTGGATTSRLADPRQIVATPLLTFVAGGTSGVVEMVQGGRVSVVAGRYPQQIATGNLARYLVDNFPDIGGIAFDETAHKLYFTESNTSYSSGDQIDAVTMVDPTTPGTWTIETLSNGLASATGLYLDAAKQTLYVTETSNHKVRSLALGTQALTTTVNTSGQLGFSGDGGPAAAARLYQPSAITGCPNGDLFIADTGNNRVRRIDATGTITTVAGTGIAASTGDGSPASFLPLDRPGGVACDAFGNVYVTSSSTVRVILADDNHVVDGTGPIQTIYGVPPRATFPTSTAVCLTGIAAVGPDTVQVADACTGILVKLQRGSATP